MVTVAIVVIDKVVVTVADGCGGRSTDGATGGGTSAGK